MDEKRMAEIERELTHLVRPDPADVRALIAEVRRLRAALLEITETLDEGPPDHVLSREGLGMIAEVARKAMGTEAP